MPRRRTEAKDPGRAETRSRMSASGCRKSRVDEAEPTQDDPVTDAATSSREEVLDSNGGPIFVMPGAGEDSSAQAKLCGKGKDPKCFPPGTINVTPSRLKPKATAKMPRH